METPGEGQVRALLTIAGNPALTTPDAGRLEGLLASLDLMVCVDPYLNATTRHADVILPPPSVLEKSHYDLAFTALSVRNVADFSPPVFERDPDRRPSSRSWPASRRSPRGSAPTATSGCWRDAAVAGRVNDAVADPTSSIQGRDPDEIMAALGDRPAEEKILDLLLRTGHRGDAFGTSPGGLSLGALEANPTGSTSGRSSRASRRRSRRSRARSSSPRPRCSPTSSASSGHWRQRERQHGARRPPSAADGQLVDAERARPRARQGQLRRPDPPGRCGRLGLVDGATASVRSAAGAINVPVELTDTIMPGVVCIPYGWGHGLPGTRQAVASDHAGVNVNVLTDASVVDPLSGNAVLNGIPVTLAPA